MNRLIHTRPLNGIFISQLVRTNHSKAAQDFKNILAEQIGSIKKAGTWKNERVITSPQQMEISVDGHSSKFLNFCANNYLGLSNNQEIIAAAQKALVDLGGGLSSVRFICGTQTIHKQLEQKITEFHERDDAILYPSCFDANAGLFEAILTNEDAIISDELNHASIIDGIRLCKAKKLVYKHRNMNDLKEKLESAQSARIRLIATDGVFSMDGNIAPLPKIVELAKKYNALVFIDECHATGFMGPNGRGTEDYFNIRQSVDIINSTLGKALGGAAGGYTTGTTELIQLLRQKARPYLFSNSIPPTVAAMGLKVIEMLLSTNQLAEAIQANTSHFRRRMTAAGFTIAGENHPICPVMLGDAQLATNFADELLKNGIYVIGFSYPVVPKGAARIRVQISAAHTIEQIDKTVEMFIKVGRQLNVIK